MTNVGESSGKKCSLVTADANIFQSRSGGRNNLTDQVQPNSPESQDFQMNCAHWKIQKVPKVEINIVRVKPKNLKQTNQSNTAMNDIYNLTDAH